MSNPVKKILITGSSGLIGSEAVTYFDRKGWSVIGVDNNMRAVFFGPDGDTTWNLQRLRKMTHRFSHHDIDIRNRTQILDLLKAERPNFIIHSAAQPSHDLACRRPFEDFDVNAAGTLNLLESARLYCPESPFIYMSTNKVYGDAPNEFPLAEHQTRYDYARPEDYHGIDEHCRIDQCLHSLFGASKAGADIMVQEYGRYFQMPTLCLRGGCLTGPNHSGTELHGFLAYLARCAKEGRTYKIYGYKGKQVRDNIHSYDVCALFDAFFERPRVAAVYNLGGERPNSISVLEAISRFEDLTGKKIKTEYINENRIGDHVCYISNMSKFKKDYPAWSITKSIDHILEELIHPQTEPASVS